MYINILNYKSKLSYYWPTGRWATALLAICLLTSCRHNLNNSPNPCANLSANPLTFKMFNQVGATSFECDSLLPGTVVFEAVKGYSSYQWIVQGDPQVFNQQQFSLEFTQPAQVNIQLIARRPPNTACFPGDQGIDTLRKTLTVLSMPSSGIPHTAIEGKYQGANIDSPSDTFTIQIRRGLDPFTTSPAMQLLNLSKGCQPPAIPVRVTYGYQGFTFFQNYPGFPSNACKLVIGSGALDLSDHRHIRLYYTEQDNGSAPRVSKVFVGQRIIK